MKIRKWRENKIGKYLIIITLLMVAGIGSYAIYGLHKLNQLDSLTGEEMLAYTTKDNKDAVITIGIIQDGKMTYKVYGENGTPLPSVEHNYEIGSITKTFTASLLSKAISENKITLDSSIDEYLNLPGKDYYPTIQRLVTHTSGYKSYYFETPMVSNFFSGVNDFNGISEEMVIERLRKIDLDDSEYSFKYSNFGIAIIGLVLEKVYEEDFTALVNQYILEDLGLVNTMVADDSGDLNHYWDWSKSDAYIPAGALVSSVTDMMEYVQKQIKGEPDYLNLAHYSLAEVNATTGSYDKMGIRIDAMGISWMLDNEKGIIWHNGATDNFNSYIGFDKEKQIGVVVLSNLPPDYKIPATIMGIEILTDLQK